jgi:hypothetical protein
MRVHGIELVRGKSYDVKLYGRDEVMRGEFVEDYVPAAVESALFYVAPVGTNVTALVPVMLRTIETIAVAS